MAVERTWLDLNRTCWVAPPLRHLRLLMGNKWGVNDGGKYAPGHRPGLGPPISAKNRKCSPVTGRYQCCALLIPASCRSVLRQLPWRPGTPPRPAPPILPPASPYAVFPVPSAPVFSLSFHPALLLPCPFCGGGQWLMKGSRLVQAYDVRSYRLGL